MWTRKFSSTPKNWKKMQCLVVYWCLLLFLASVASICMIVLHLTISNVEISSAYSFLDGRVETSNDSELRKTILSALEEEAQWDYPEIDVVYTWVNGSDPAWKEKKERHFFEFLAEIEKKPLEQVKKEEANANQGVNADARFRDHQELKYSMRSILKYAPWVRYIHVVVADGQQPNWLNISHPKIRLVPHSVLFTNTSHLPVFSSNSIEAQLDNVPDLSEHFLYFNDDFFLGLPINQSEFLPDRTSGNQRVFFDFWQGIHACSKNCTFDMMGNGKCDASCNNPACNFDMGDCGLAARVEGMKKFREDEKKRVYNRHSGSFESKMIYVDGVFNRKLGKTPLSENRRPIAHTPYFFSKRLFRDLKHRFRKEFDLTISHRFRHTMNMQLQFSYFHYFIHERVFAPTKKQIWRAALLTSQAQEPFLYGVKRGKPNAYQQAKRDWIEACDSYRVLKQCAHEILQNGPHTFDVGWLKSCDDAAEQLNQDYELRLPIKALEIVTPSQISEYLLFLVFRTMKPKHCSF